MAGYATRDSGLVYIHREVWEEAHGPIPEGFIVDHINGDKLDNRLVNLRLATQGQNLQNAAIRRDNKHGIKGLSREGSMWRGALVLNGKQYKKRHKDLFEVLCWLHSTRRALHGEFARHH